MYCRYTLFNINWVIFFYNPDFLQRIFPHGSVVGAEEENFEVRGWCEGKNRYQKSPPSCRTFGISLRGARWTSRPKYRRGRRRSRREARSWNWRWPLLDNCQHLSDPQWSVLDPIEYICFCLMASLSIIFILLFFNLTALNNDGRLTQAMTRVWPSLWQESDYQNFESFTAAMPDRAHLRVRI